MESKVNTQNQLSKGQARIMVVILVCLAAALIFFTYFLLKKPVQTPPAVSVSSVSAEKQAALQKEAEAKAEKNALEGNSGLSGAIDSSGQKLAQDAQKQPAQPRKVHGSYLAAGKEEVSVTVDEGQRINAAFTLTNNGAQPITLNLYKSELDQTRQLAEQEMERLLQGPVQASVFAGTPWLMLFPTSVTLKASESKTIQLTVDARALGSGDNHTAYVYAVGTESGDSLLLPVEIKVTQAPKMALARIQVDDGFSAGTKGNKNSIANPQETVAVTAYLENRGNASAEGLTVEVSSSDATAVILENSLLHVPSLASGSQIPVRILMRVAADAHPVFPPALYVTMTDKENRRWQESFSAGDPGKVQYPTGILTEKDQDKIIESK